MTEEEPSSTTHGTERLEALSDGVFAIAVTLLVLSISVSPGTRRLPQDLLNIWPEYVSYAMSFLIIGIIWAQHHSLFMLIKRTDHVFLLINILFLMWISFLPFPAHVLGQELGRHGEQTAMAFYAGTFVVGALLFNLVWRYAAHGRRLLGADASDHLITVTNRSYSYGPFMYLLDLGLAFVSVAASFIVFFLLAIFFALAPIPAVGRTWLFRPFTGLTKEGSS